MKRKEFIIIHPHNSSSFRFWKPSYHWDFHKFSKVKTGIVTLANFCACVLCVMRNKRASTGIYTTDLYVLLPAKCLSASMIANALSFKYGVHICSMQQQKKPNQPVLGFSIISNVSNVPTNRLTFISSLLERGNRRRNFKQQQSIFITAVNWFAPTVICVHRTYKWNISHLTSTKSSQEGVPAISDYSKAQ